MNRGQSLMMAICAVTWCAALAVPRSKYCAVHYWDPKAPRPEEYPAGATPKPTGYHWKPVPLVKWPWGPPIRNE